MCCNSGHAGRTEFGLYTEREIVGDSRIFGKDRQPDPFLDFPYSDFAFADIRRFFPLAQLGGRPCCFRHYVRGWITIDGTHIDYPVVQGKFDYEYLNKDVFGKYVLSGSIFMSTTNAPGFSDPYTLIYGHHMDNGAMFGDIDLFENKTFFEKNRTGTLYTKDKTYKVEIFACVFTDAYDSNMYSQSAQTNEDLASFESYIQSVSVQFRPADLQSGAHIIALSSCWDVIANVRHLLIGKLVPK